MREGAGGSKRNDARGAGGCTNIDTYKGVQYTRVHDGCRRVQEDIRGCSKVQEGVKCCRRVQKDAGECRRVDKGARVCTRVHVGV